MIRLDGLGLSKCRFDASLSSDTPRIRVIYYILYVSDCMSGCGGVIYRSPSVGITLSSESYTCAFNMEVSVLFILFDHVFKNQGVRLRNPMRMKSVRVVCRHA